MESDHPQNTSVTINEHEQGTVLLEPVPSVALGEATDGSLPKVDSQADNSPSQDNNEMEKSSISKSELRDDHDNEEDDDDDKTATNFTPVNYSMTTTQGAAKRPNSRFSKSQLARLQVEATNNMFPSIKHRKQLAQDMGIDCKRINSFFVNARAGNYSFSRNRKENHNTAENEIDDVIGPLDSAGGQLSGIDAINPGLPPGKGKRKWQIATEVLEGDAYSSTKRIAGAFPAAKLEFDDETLTPGTKQEGPVHVLSTAEPTDENYPRVATPATSSTSEAFHSSTTAGDLAKKHCVAPTSDTAIEALQQMAALMSFTKDAPPAPMSSVIGYRDGRAPSMMHLPPGPASKLSSANMPRIMQVRPFIIDKFMRVSHAASLAALGLLTRKQQARVAKKQSNERRVGRTAVSYSTVLMEMLKQAAFKQSEMSRLEECIATQRKACADLKDEQQAAKETYDLLNQKLRDYKTQYNIPGTTNERKAVLMAEFDKLYEEVLAKRDAFRSIEDQREALKSVIATRENQRISLRSQIHSDSQPRQYMEVAMARKLDSLAMLPLTDAALDSFPFSSTSSSI